jgi:hypothetical protein
LEKLLLLAGMFISLEIELGIKNHPKTLKNFQVKKQHDSATLVNYFCKVELGSSVMF